MNNNVTHYDGADVIVLDLHGRCLRDVDEVHAEPDRAVIALKPPLKSAWTAADCPRLAELASCTVHSAHDGMVRWQGPCESCAAKPRVAISSPRRPWPVGGHRTADRYKQGARDRVSSSTHRGPISAESPPPRGYLLLADQQRAWR
jgi:hypothetical protein